MYFVQKLSAAARLAAPILSRKPIEGTIKRHGHVMYRQFTKPSQRNEIIAEVVMGTMWFWILWRFYHEPEAVFGHWDIPDPSKWTDEELGIPPDDAD